MENLVRINLNMVPRAAVSCAGAFENDPHIVFLIPDKKKRANLHYSFEYYMRIAIIGGSEAYASSNQCEGIAIWKSSEIKEPWDLLFRCGNPLLALRCGFRFIWADMLANQHCAKLRDKLTPKPYMYLAALSVDPAHQGKGLASSLVKPMLKRLDESGLPCFLETQNAQNVKMYQHFGFETVYEGLFPGTPTRLYAMLRKSGS